MPDGFTDLNHEKCQTVSKPLGWSRRDIGGSSSLDGDYARRLMRFSSHARDW